jgi:HNH endonuclease
MPTNISDDVIQQLTRYQIEIALKASDQAGSMREFYVAVGMSRSSRSYFVRQNGKLHSLKAVVTYACQKVNPNIQSTDFHAVGGARRLRALGFDVEHRFQKADEKRETEWIKRLQRRGQSTFRNVLIDIYGGCPLTGCTTISVLEAAHVKPVSESGADARQNGVLLRVDLHKLFDANLLAIDPASGHVCLAAECRQDYGELLSGVRFSPPPNGPKLNAFANRWCHFQALSAKQNSS